MTYSDGGPVAQLGIEGTGDMRFEVRLPSSRLPSNDFLEGDCEGLYCLGRLADVPRRFRGSLFRFFVRRDMSQPQALLDQVLPGNRSNGLTEWSGKRFWWRRKIIARATTLKASHDHAYCVISYERSHVSSRIRLRM